MTGQNTLTLARAFTSTVSTQDENPQRQGPPWPASPSKRTEVTREAQEYGLLGSEPACQIPPKSQLSSGLLAPPLVPLVHIHTKHVHTHSTLCLLLLLGGSSDYTPHGTPLPLPHLYLPKGTVLSGPIYCIPQLIWEFEILFLLFFYYVHVCISMCGFVDMSAGAHTGQ